MTAIGLASAGCGGNESETTAQQPQTFAKSDLARLNLAKSEAPQGLNYNTRTSGPNLLENEGGGQQLLSELRKKGFQADYGTEFAGSPTSGPLSYEESLGLVFDNANGAHGGFALVDRQFTAFSKNARRIPHPDLGDESAAITGSFGPITTFTYIWRVGNVIQSAVVGQGTATPAETERLGRRLATKLESRASS